MSWGAVIGGATALVGGALSSNASKKAANASQQGYDAASAEQARQFDITQQNQQPWLQAGQNALTQQQALMNGDFSGFYQSPDYQYALDSGLQAVNRGAIGNLSGGGTAADLVTFGEGLASQNYNNYYNRLAGMSNTGQTTANNLAQYGQDYASQQGKYALGAASAQGSAYKDQAEIWGNTVEDLGDAAMYYYGQNGNKWRR